MKKFISAIAVLALSGAAAGSLLVSSPSAKPIDPLTLNTRGGTVSLVCLGGVAPGVKAGVSAGKVDEKLTGRSLLLTSASGGTWSDASGQRRLAVGALVSPTTSELGVGDARGSATFPVASLENTVVAGASYHEAQAGDLRGVAVSPCVWGTSDAYLVGGSGTVGNANRLMLSNPALTPVTVDIAGFSANGPVRLGDSSQVVIAPGGYQEIRLDGLIPTKEELALHLTTKSGRFGAVLQNSALDGTTPTGVAFLSPSVSGKDLVIPGVSVPAEGDSLLPDPAWVGKVRLVNPSTRPATVSVSTIDDAGSKPLEGAQEVSIVAGGVLDLTLTGLRPGNYAVRVQADSPVSAAVGTSLTATAGTDTAWASALPALSSSAAVASGTLHLVGEAKAKVTTYGTDGAVVETRDVTVTHATTVDIAKASAVSVESDQPVRGAVAVKTANGIDWVPLTTSGSAVASLDVRTLN
ncbi:hypothetical protein J2S49_001424 [Arcanobacterium wilhelmae]|uniref:Uncharacterized protein n=1 Tax=Arcanobacterium wilhelmae TaxID=1803177 RepID=A0ABT9NCV2_9ACTO|nr:DUF5719 family protein [Arcanobacterium wilhelmae]MDP9801348.1 hypothetical protein [Arcanobacterium wilhelmae]WFN90685.1 DUF5719 family protein [Arcanobacterium wilhelmae]